MSDGPAPRSLFARARPLVIARTGAAVLSFVIPLALARALTQEDYGTYKLFLLIAGTLYAVLPLGMAQTIYFFVPRATVRRAYLVHTLAFLLAMGLVALAALLLLGDRLAAWFDNAHLAAYALPLGLFTLGILSSLPLEVAQTARGHTRRAAVTYIASDALKALLMAGPAFLGFGLPGVAVGLGAFGVLRLAATWAVVLRGETGPAFDRERFKAQLRFALPFGAAMLLAIPTQYFHQYVVASRLDAAAFAVYAVGIFQLPVVDLLYTPTSEILMVRVAELEREGRSGAVAAVFREAVTKLAAAFVPLTVFLVAAAPELITALFTSRYLGAVPVFRVVVVGTLLACLPVDGLLRARDQTRHILLSYAVKAAVAVPLVLFAVSRFGMMGAVGSWLAAEVVGKAVLFSRLPRVLGVKALDLFPWSELARFAAAAVLATGGVFAAHAALGARAHALSLLLADVALFGVAYLAASVLVDGELPLGLDGVVRRALRLPRGRAAS